MEPVVAIPGELVMRQGEKGDRMFFVVRQCLCSSRLFPIIGCAFKDVGVCDVYKEESENSTWIAEFSAGDSFGEVAFWTGSHKRTATVQGTVQVFRF